MINNKEIWRPTVSYNGYVEVSNLGRVKMLDTIHKQKDRIITGTINKGWIYVNIRINGISHIEAVHILVAEAFYPPTTYTNHVIHLDGDKLNNEVSNLKWAVKEEFYKTKAVDQFTENLEYIRTFTSQKELIDTIGTSHRTLYYHLKGTRRKKLLKGFIFKNIL